jgi:hypothetical protein
VNVPPRSIQKSQPALFAPPALLIKPLPPCRHTVPLRLEKYSRQINRQRFVDKLSTRHIIHAS